MAGKVEKTYLEKFSDSLDNALAYLKEIYGLSDEDRKGLASRIDDLKRATAQAAFMATAQEKVVVIDRLTGEMTTLEGLKAKLAQWRAIDEAGYNDYAQKAQEFLAQFSDESIFIHMFGRHGEKLLLTDKEVSTK